jgi:hypothetical protein
MTSFALSLIFLLSAGQQATEVPAPQPTAVAEAATPEAEPKMVCKYEHVTGSRLQKTKICRPENEKGQDQDTKLQRQLSRNGDYRDLSGTGLGGN